MQCFAILVVRFDANCFAWFEKQASFFVLSSTKEKKQKRKNIEAKKTTTFFTYLGLTNNHLLYQLIFNTDSPLSRQFLTKYSMTFEKKLGRGNAHWTNYQI